MACTSCVTCHFHALATAGAAAKALLSTSLGSRHLDPQAVSLRPGTQPLTGASCWKQPGSSLWQVLGADCERGWMCQHSSAIPLESACTPQEVQLYDKLVSCSAMTSTATSRASFCTLTLAKMRDSKPKSSPHMHTYKIQSRDHESNNSS